jgi:probable HAF family extracellular repeat protein
MRSFTSVGMLSVIMNLMLAAAPVRAQPLFSVTPLGTLGGSTAQALGINASGQVTGVALTSGNAANHAFLYSGGVMADLGTLGGSYSVGVGINAIGQVTGYAVTPGDAANHAFLYSGGIMADLGTLGGTNSSGDGINASGQIMGTPTPLGMGPFMRTSTPAASRPISARWEDQSVPVKASTPADR